MDLSNLNDQQKNAIINTFDNNCIVIAGAGSGKTRVLTNRVGYLIDDMGVNPKNIMAVTFTNKAANELKVRLTKICNDLSSMWVGTFHSICVKILKNFGEDIGIKNFTIMDTKDSKELMKEVLKSKNIPIEKSTITKYLNKISRYKNNLINSKEVFRKATKESEREFAQIYDDFENESWRRRAFDFDDLIVYTVALLIKSKRTRDWFHDNVKYIMVDESQDVNTSQFKLLSLLAGNNNLYLVGDVDQSIYGFRSAKPEYLMNFKKLYPNAKILKLEQNYRSCGNIVQASNALIKNNNDRYDKKCFTNNRMGDPIIYHKALNAKDESNWIANEIFMNSGVKNYSDIAILYRTNYQSRAIEDALMKLNIPYKLIGSTSFYERKEVKDIMAFLKFKANRKDLFSFKRSLGCIAGIGMTSIQKIVDCAKNNNIDLYSALDYVKLTQRGQSAIRVYKDIIENSNDYIPDMIIDVAEKSGILRNLYNENTQEALSRIDNIKELSNVALEYVNKNKNLTLEDFINNVALMSATDKTSENGAVSLMTIHSSKGLEFDTVFIIGMEEGILPHNNALLSKKDIEEERRLCYVAITRAKNNLYLTSAQTRMDSSSILVCQESRFLNEIKDYIIKV